jgi:RNAse (barnase) inhibitor barstar
MSVPLNLDAQRSGVFAAGGLRPLERAVRRAGWAWLPVDLSACGDKNALLAACRRDLVLPGHFGANWDALADCLGDLSWRPAAGYVLVFRGSERLARDAPEVLAVLAEVLRAAAAGWQSRARGFIALIEPAPASLGLAKFKAS